MEWAAFGAVFLALVVCDFANHIYYFAKNVWPVKLTLHKPKRVMPLSGAVTLHGIVSSIGEDCPVQVTIIEHGVWQRGAVLWRQISSTVHACPFALILPELGARIIVEPRSEVRLRAFATATDWEKDQESGELHRVRTAMLKDGDHAIVTGILGESREVELIANQYRSQKEKIRVEYVLKPKHDEPMAIDSETLLHEISERFGNLGWARGIGSVVLVSAYVHAASEAFSSTSVILYGFISVVYIFIRIGAMGIDRVPWFDRHKSLKKPYTAIEENKPIHR